MIKTKEKMTSLYLILQKMILYFIIIYLYYLINSILHYLSIYSIFKWSQK